MGADVVAGLHETNVRVLPCVIEALDRIAARRGLSRDEAIRQVLAAHVADQEAQPPQDRLTHVSTVLRHPAPAGRGRPRVDRQLRLRLPEGLAERARAVSFRLPGQHVRAYKDYVARQLTDAVVTAIARHERFTDDVLDGLLPVLRHDAALHLWQLAVTVTSTRPECAIQDAAEVLRRRPPANLKPDERRLLLISEQLDEEVSWHAPFRFEAATRLARQLLSGSDAAAKESMLYEQGAEWNSIRLALRRDSELRRRIRGVAPWDASGRGSTAVWRAARKVDLQDFADWLLALDGRTPQSLVLDPPGWSVRVPAGWATHVVPHGRQLPARFAQWAATGQVIVWPLNDRQVVWPVRPGHHLPVPGVEPLAAVARKLRPQETLEYIEAILVEWGAPPYGAVDDVWVDDVDPYDGMVEAERETPQLWLPVDKAFDLGFIDAEQRRTAMAAAHAYTRSSPDALTSTRPVVLKPEPTLDPDFCLIPTRRRTGRTAKPMWRWPRGSVAQEVFAGTPSAIVGWLADRALWMARRTLHHVMDQAWHDGFDHHPVTFWRPGGISDDDLV